MYSARACKASDVYGIALGMTKTETADRMCIFW